MGVHTSWPRAEINRMWNRSINMRDFEKWKQFKLLRFRQNFFPQSILEDCKNWSPGKNFKYRGQCTGEDIDANTEIWTRHARLVIPYSVHAKRISSAVSNVCQMYRSILIENLRALISVCVVYKNGSVPLHMACRRLQY